MQEAEGPLEWALLVLDRCTRDPNARGLALDSLGKCGAAATLLRLVLGQRAPAGGHRRTKGGAQPDAKAGAAASSAPGEAAAVPRVVPERARAMAAAVLLNCLDRRSDVARQVRVRGWVEEKGELEGWGYPPF